MARSRAQANSTYTSVGKSLWCQSGFLKTLERDVRRGICLLQIDTPITERVQRSLCASHSAQYKRARPHDTIFAIEEFKIRQAIGPEIAFHLIHERSPEREFTHSSRRA